MHCILGVFQTPNFAILLPLFDRYLSENERGILVPRYLTGVTQGQFIIRRFCLPELDQQHLVSGILSPSMLPIFCDASGRVMINTQFIVSLVTVMVGWVTCLFANGPFLGCAFRWGEALHPGPTYRFAVTNPTSVVSKFDHYARLKEQYDIDVFVAAETSATAVAQRVFSQKIRSLSMKVGWSVPVPDQFETLSGASSMRGKASGVAAFSSLPIRDAIDTLPVEVTAMSRLSHHVVTLGVMHVQLIVVYGFPATYRDSHDRNCQLLQNALQASDCLPLPTIIAGDFNCNPFDLDVAIDLRHRGFQDLQMLHRKLYGSVLPFTCRQATHPDNALICSSLMSTVESIQVHTEPLFDTHCPVIFDLAISHAEQYRTRMDMPRSWIPLGLDDSFWISAYDSVRDLHGPPADLPEWGVLVEHAADRVFRETQHYQDKIPYSCTKGLTSVFRGRCQPRKVKKYPIQSLTKKGRPGDFQPKQEVHSFATMKLITQLRRIRSMKGQLAKLQGCPIDTQREKSLLQEWHSILKCRTFPGGFVTWCCNTPEVGPPSQDLPTVEFLYDIDQLLTHDINDRTQRESAVWKTKQEFKRQQDRRFHGSSQAFAILRDSPSNYVEEIKLDIAERGIVASDPDSDHLEIFVDRSQEFNPIDVVHVNSFPCRIHEVQEHSIVIRRHPDLLPEGVEVTVNQSQVVVDKAKIFELLTSFWQPFWQTTSAIDASDMHSFESFLHLLPQDLPQIHVELDDFSLWKAAIHDCKAHSARGVDAISAAELKDLPDEAIRDLMKVVTHAYKNGFPSWFMTARTFPLSKVDGSPQPGQTRPISVLSQVYRIWARVCCRQILCQLSATMPPEIQGLLRNRGPLEAAYHQQFSHEASHFANQPAGGMSIDLIKCFNTMCRRCGSLALRALRIPNYLVCQWEASIAVLSRIWVIGSDCSSPVASSNGYPEGDTWSVVVMVALSFCWVIALRAKATQSCISSYADNWGWYTINPQMHCILIDQTVLFVRATNMQIDWAKSWTWSTDSAHSHAIKSALRRHGQVDQVTQINTTMNLGCQMTYRGPPKLGCFRSRLAKAINRLDQLRKLKRPLDEKIKLANSSVFACAFYGVQFIPLGISHFDRVRVALADSLLGTSASRNSALAIDCLPGIDDPLVLAIILAVKTARKFIMGATLGERHAFFRIASRHPGTSHTCKGPASSLKFYLLQLGWTISKEGDIHTMKHGPLSLVKDGVKTLTAAIRMAWTQDVLLMSDRKCFRGLPAICQVSTQQVLRKFTLKEQQCLITDISGSFQTRSQQAKWDPTIDNCCVMCGAIDTRYHRIFECPVFDDIRARFQTTLSHFMDQGSYAHELPVIHVNPALDFVRLLQSQHPEAVVPEALHDRLVLLVEDLAQVGCELHFYTDGSCQVPHCPVTRFASYAIILDTCLCDSDREHMARIFQQTGILPPTLVPLAAARTTGIQCIHRSEFFAITRTVESFSRGRVFSDSSLALHHVQCCKGASDLAQVQQLPDFDLVTRLFNCASLPRFSFRKVKAHIDPMTLPNLQTVYQTLGNQLANDKAIQSCWHLLPEIVDEYWRLHIQYELEKERLEEYYRFLLELFQRRVHLDRNNADNQAHIDVLSQKARIDYFNIFCDWTVLSTWHMPPCRVQQFSEGTWGRSLTTAVMQWLQLCQWPDGTPDSRDTFGVTWMELTTSFVLYIGQWLPLKRPTGHGSEQLVNFDDTNLAEVYNVTFSEQVRGFCQLFGQANDLALSDLWPKLPRGLVRSAYLLGAPTQPAGVRMRPNFPYQQQVCSVLKKYYRQHSGMAYTKLPDIEFGERRFSTLQLRIETAGTWKVRAARFARAASDIRRQRLRPARPLMFH